MYQLFRIFYLKNSLNFFLSLLSRWDGFHLWMPIYGCLLGSQEVLCMGVQTYSGQLGSCFFQSACVLVIHHPFPNIIILNQKSEYVVHLRNTQPSCLKDKTQTAA